MISPMPLACPSGVKCKDVLSRIKPKPIFTCLICFVSRDIVQFAFWSMVILFFYSVYRPSWLGWESHSALLQVERFVFEPHLWPLLAQL